MPENMKTITLAILMIFYGRAAGAADVTFLWDPHPDPTLDHYTLYQADLFEAHTGPWLKVKDVDKIHTTTTITVEDDKNYTWHLTATNLDSDESGPSNAVMLYERKRIDTPTCLGIPIPKR